MPYSTGTGLTIGDFIDALKTFTLAQGWTIGKYDTDDHQRLLFASKGACFVAMHWEADVSAFEVATRVSVYPALTLGASTDTPDNRLHAVLGTSLDNSKLYGDWWQQPGNLSPQIASPGSESDAICNNLAGPFTAWYLFSNASGSYIHAVVQTGELFTHFSFGELEQGELTHGGVAYVTGTINKWWKDQNTLNPADPAYNKPSGLVSYPTHRGVWSAPDALPAGFPAIHNMLDKITPAVRYAEGPNYPSQMGNRLLSMHALASKPTWSDVAPLFGIPFLIRNTANDQFCCPGFMPDMRLLNMEGMSPGEEIDFSGDTWKVFPHKRQTNWGDVGTVMAASSGQYAVAYKKIP